MNKKKFTSLAQWLTWITTIHPREIELGLERVKVVCRRLDLKYPLCPIVIVGGTNGKGSCVAALEKIYSLQGYRTGVFTSPFLYRHNEILRIQGREAEDALFCEAYAKIEAARKEVSLTPFEYHTLAALEILQQQALDVWIMEVGLGGRLDAVNILDADLAIITSIGIDHVDWLGDTRELIAREKAGIFRAKRPVVCGDFDPPFSLREQAQQLAAPFYCQGQDFRYAVQEETETWSWRGKKGNYAELPFSPLAFQNLSTALMGIELLQSKLPVAEAAVYQAVKAVSLPGRVEISKGWVTEIRDVSHNPAAIAYLAGQLKKMPCPGKTQAIFSMLADKALPDSLREIKNQIDQWHVAPLAAKRGASLAALHTAFQQEQITSVCFYDSIGKAYEAAQSSAKENDRLVIFGSFYTVGECKMT